MDDVEAIVGVNNSVDIVFSRAGSTASNMFPNMSYDEAFAKHHQSGGVASTAAGAAAGESAAPPQAPAGTGGQRPSPASGGGGGGGAAHEMPAAFELWLNDKGLSGLDAGVRSQLAAKLSELGADKPTTWRSCRTGSAMSSRHS